MSLKRGKSTTSSRKYQKVIVVVKRTDRYICKSLVDRVKAGVRFYLATSHVLKG